MKNITIAVDLGTSNLRVGLVNKSGKIIKKIQTSVPDFSNSQTVISKTITVLINSLLENFDKKSIKGISIATSGIIDFENGIIAPNNLVFKKIYLKQPIEDYFKIPVKLINDCDAAVMAEHEFGVSKKYKNIVYITISDNISAGIIMNGQLLSGHNHNAGNIGHFIMDNNKWTNSCSGHKITNSFKKWLKNNGIKIKYPIENAKDLFYLSEDENIANFLREIIELNIKGTMNVISAYDPEIIIFGGSIILNNQDLLFAPIKNYFNSIKKSPKIIITRLGEDSCLIGAGISF